MDKINVLSHTRETLIVNQAQETLIANTTIKNQ